MKDEARISVDEWHELEGLRVRIFNRLGMSTAAARAYENCDLDMLRSLDALLDEHSSTTHAENICKAVVRLRQAHGASEVASFITEDHVRLGTSIHGLLLTSTLMRGERYNYESREALEDILTFVYQNLELQEQVKAVMSRHITDSEEVLRMTRSFVGSAPALVEGTL